MMASDDLERRLETLASQVDTLKTIIDGTEATYAEKVRAYLRQTNLYYAQLTLAADVLGVTRDQLGYGLRREGVTFKNLLDDERRRRVEVYLSRTPDAPCQDLSRIAGYHEYPNFIRAFKRWFGMGLTEYKKITRMDT